MSTRPPYQGPHRKLVLAFDIGTTFSGISYSILDPGEVPQIRGVTRYPAQEHVGGDSKIPTIVYYDQQGNVRAVGAEAMREGIEEQAEDGGWTKAEWFKLHLRPRTQSAAHITEEIPPLPEGKAAIDIFADFLRYLHQCARTYIEETHDKGVELWKNLESRPHFVLTNPNGWEGGQQSLMRKAAVMAGLIPDTPSGHERISFVTEGEASLHFCIQSGLTNEAIKSGKGVLIVDAGRRTIDISTYKQTSQHTKSFEEIAAPQCHFQGSIFVTNNARAYLENFLKNSRFLGDVPHITDCFDKTTKLRFRNADESQYIKFGSLRDNDQKLNIRLGQLKLNGSDVASFFEPSIQCIVKSIEEQCAASQTEIASVFLIGGFGASDWLFTKLKEIFSPRGLNISRPDSHINKAVADGAVSFYVDYFAHDDLDREIPRRTKRERSHDLAKDVESLKQQLHSSQKELGDADLKITSYEKTIKAFQRERDSISTHFISKISDQVEKVQIAERKVAELELQILQERLRASEDKQSQMAKPLDERTSDLKGVQTFLTIDDLYSGGDIIKMVESLNAEILQTAGFIAELLVDESTIAKEDECARNVQYVQQNLKTAQAEIGNVLFAFLSNQSNDVRADPLPLQLALQHLLATWCSYNVGLFSSNKLQDLYQKIRSSEVQEIAGRWRAITSAHLQNSETPYGVKRTINIIRSLLYLCGWSSSSPQAQKSISTMRQMVSAIEKLHIQLKIAMNEGITTADMEVFHISPGGQFGEHMVDTYADSVGGSTEVAYDKESVLCTVGMGLRRSVTKRGEGGEASNHIDVLLKAKVALASVLLDTTQDGTKDVVLPRERQDGRGE